MPMRVKILFFLVMFINFCTLAQTYFGFRAEPFYELTKIEKRIDYPIPTTTIENSSNGNFALSLALSFDVSEKIGISIRPGFVLGGLYSGFDGGLLIAYDVFRNCYILGGVNTHLNFGGGGNTLSSDGVTIPYAVTGLGFDISRNGSIELQFNYSLNQVSYGSERHMQSSPPYTTMSYYRIPWLIKVSFGLGWEL